MRIHLQVVGHESQGLLDIERDDVLGWAPVGDHFLMVSFLSPDGETVEEFYRLLDVEYMRVIHDVEPEPSKLEVVSGLTLA